MHLDLGRVALCALEVSERLGSALVEQCLRDRVSHLLELEGFGRPNTEHLQDVVPEDCANRGGHLARFNGEDLSIQIRMQRSPVNEPEVSDLIPEAR